MKTTKYWEEKETLGISNIDGLDFSADVKYWQTCEIVVKGTSGKAKFNLNIKIGSNTVHETFTLNKNESKSFFYSVQNCCTISVNGNLSNANLSFGVAGGNITVTCEYQSYNSTKWMAELDDRIKISQITIPGTHDTCALYNNPWTICQKLNISDQLKKGIRFLDIRCRHFENKFTIHHEMVYQNIDFDQVLDQCESFLKSNNSECILMSIKEEYKEENCTRTFEATFDDYISKRSKELWYLENKLPLLSEVKGKIVILRRFSSSCQNKGINVSGWKDNTTFTLSLPGSESVKIQDHYKYDTINGKTNKWKAVSSLLTDSRNNSSQENLYLNFSSATGVSNENLINTPEHVANDINPMLLTYFKDNSKGRFGVIIMDFPTEELINKIIISNK